MDCCHSGTNTRAIQPPDVKVKQRYLPSPWGIGAAESGRSLPRNVTSELRRSPRSARKGKDIVNADLPEVLITGCRDTQTSADAFINGRYNGALTFALVEAIRKSKGRLTYKAASRSRVDRAEDQEVRSGAPTGGTDSAIRRAPVLMSDKRLTVILYGCDRAIWRGGPVDLRIVDIFAAGGPRPLYEGRSRRGDDRSPAAVAVRCRPGLRLHLLGSRPSSCVATCAARRLHPRRRTGGSRRCDSEIDAHAGFAGDQ